MSRSGWEPVLILPSFAKTSKNPHNNSRTSTFYMPGTHTRWITWFDFSSPSDDPSDGWDHHLHITDRQAEVLKAEAPGAVTIRLDLAKPLSGGLSGSSQEPKRLAAHIVQMRTLKLRKESHLSTTHSNHVSGPGILPCCEGPWAGPPLCVLPPSNVNSYFIITSEACMTVAKVLSYTPVAPLIRPAHLQMDSISSILKSGGPEIE